MLARKKLLLGVKWGIIKGTAIKILRTKPPKPYLKESIFNKNFKTRFESRDYLKKSIRSYTMVSYMYGIAAQVMIKPLMNIFLSRSHVYFEKRKKKQFQGLFSNLYVSMIRVKYRILLLTSSNDWSCRIKVIT